MRGLDPRIHLLRERMDCRVEFTTGPAKAGPTGNDERKDASVKT
jgi:hypothetical protein